MMLTNLGPVHEFPSTSFGQESATDILKAAFFMHDLLLQDGGGGGVTFPLFWD